MTFSHQPVFLILEGEVQSPVLAGLFRPFSYLLCTVKNAGERKPFASSLQGSLNCFIEYVLRLSGFLLKEQVVVFWSEPDPHGRQEM